MAHTLKTIALMVMGACVIACSVGICFVAGKLECAHPVMAHCDVGAALVLACIGVVMAVGAPRLAEEFEPR